MKSRFLNKLTVSLGLDFHVRNTILYRVWAIVSGILSVILIVRFLNPTQQGYYFTFASLIGLQVFFELGLNQVLTQIAAHRVSKVNAYDSGINNSSKSLSSLLRQSSKWNLLMSVLFFIGIFPVGILILNNHIKNNFENIDLIWLAILFVTAINLALSNRLAILEGMGKVGQVARLRFRLSVLGALTLWMALILGAGVWAVCASASISAFGTLFWCLYNKEIKALNRDLIVKNETKQEYSYIKDIFPLQSRVAISWVSGYFISAALVPFVFTFHGPEVAGRLGLALTIFSAIATLGSSWINTQLPKLSGCAANNDRQQMNITFKKSSRLSILATTISVLAFLTLVFIGRYADLVIVSRIPDAGVLVLLSLMTIANSIIQSMAVYIRAHKKEPLVWLSLGSALIISLGVYVAVETSLMLAIAIYTLVPTLVGIPWCYKIFIPYYKSN